MDEIAATRAELGWNHPPFEIPADILDAWRAAGSRGAAAHQDWQKRLNSNANGAEFTRRMNGELPQASAMQNYLASLVANPA